MIGPFATYGYTHVGIVNRGLVLTMAGGLETWRATCNQTHTRVTLSQ
jgi:hypothetical protein